MEYIPTGLKVVNRNNNVDHLDKFSFSTSNNAFKSNVSTVHTAAAKYAVKQVSVKALLF